MKTRHSALRRAVSQRSQISKKEAFVPDYSYSRNPDKLSQTFEATKKFEVGDLVFNKGDIVHVRYTGSAGIYDIINDKNDQERIDHDEMMSLIQDNNILPYLM